MKQKKTPLRLCLVEGHRSMGQWSMSLYANEIRAALENSENPIEIASVQHHAPSVLSALGRFPLWNRIEKRWVRHVLMPRQIQKIDADVFHCVEPGDSIALRNLNTRQMVITCHDLIPWRLKNLHRKPAPLSWASARLHEQLKTQFLQAACIITPSVNTQKDLIEFSGISANRTRVIPYSLNRVFTPQTFQQNALLPAQPFFLHVG